MNSRKLKQLIIFLILLFSSCKQNQTLTFIRKEIDGKSNPISYYTGFKSKLNSDKVVLIISGSNRVSTTEEFAKGTYAKNYDLNIVYLEKTFYTDFKQLVEYDDRYQKLHDLKAVITDLKQSGVKEIIILADAEGTMIAPEISRIYSESVVGLICLSGSLNSLRAGLIYYSSRTDTQKTFNFSKSSLDEILIEIDKNPNSKELDFLNLPNIFWSSYMDYTPLNDLAKLSIPILYINGENDNINLTLQGKLINELQYAGIDIQEKIYDDIGNDLLNIDNKIIKFSSNWLKEKSLIGK